MQFKLIPVFILVISAFSCMGCVHQREHDTRRFWADWNTLGEPALFLEQKDHKPYNAARVGNFRWAYGKDPGHQYYFPYYMSADDISSTGSDPFFDSALPVSEPELNSLPPSYSPSMMPLPRVNERTTPLNDINNPVPPSPGLN